MGIDLYEIIENIIEAVNKGQTVILYFYPDYVIICDVPIDPKDYSKGSEYLFITEDQVHKEYTEDELEDFYRDGFPVQFFTVQFKERLISYPETFHPNRALLSVLRHFFVSTPSNLLSKKFLEDKLRKEKSTLREERWTIEGLLESRLLKHDIDLILVNQGTSSETDYEITFLGKSINRVWSVVEEFEIPWDSDRMFVTLTKEDLISVSFYDPRVVGGIFPGYSPLKIVLEKFLPPKDLLYMIEQKFIEEDEFIEFKVRLPKNMSEIAKKICAFCNLNSGVLFIGVTDDGKIVGCDIELTMQRLSGIFSHVLEPPVQPTFRIIYKAREISVLMVLVPSTEKPTRTNNIAYTMVGRTVKPLSFQEEKDIESCKQKGKFLLNKYAVFDYLIEKYEQFKSINKSYNV